MASRSQTAAVEYLLLVLVLVLLVFIFLHS